MTNNELGAVTFDNLLTALTQAAVFTQRTPRILELMAEWVEQYIDDEHNNMPADHMIADVFTAIKRHVDQMR